MQDYTPLQGEYKLSNFNGLDIEKEKVYLSLKEVDGKLHIRAKVANIIKGFLSYENTKLMGMLASTKMLGNAFENDVEHAIVKGFSEGMTVAHEADGLVFTQGKYKLKFVPKK